MAHFILHLLCKLSIRFALLLPLDRQAIVGLKNEVKDAQYTRSPIEALPTSNPE